MGLDNVVSNISNVFVNFLYFLEGLVQVKLPVLILLTDIFYAKFRATYHDAHRKCINPNFKYQIVDLKKLRHLILIKV